VKGITVGLFGNKDKIATAAPVAQATSSSGKISLVKGATISLTKTVDATISASNGWKAKNKDYDLKALVRYKDGRQIYVGAANSDEVLATPEGAVRHGGDVRAGSSDLETITIKWHPDIASVALSSYSALENGQGSFHQYGVYVNIKNGDQLVGIDAADASADGESYTLCFGEVTFQPDHSFNVTNLELYSKRGSEHRIGYKHDKVVMDAGPKGKNK
jgi:tellurium resistance protein TerD